MPNAQLEGAIVVEEVLFPAGAYRLQGELAYAEANAPCGVAVLAGPHPLLGGNLHNNVVRGLGDGLAQRGLASLRFNYRGVGRSEGQIHDVARHLRQFWETSHVPEEADYWQDVQGAVAFARRAVGPELPLLLAGYSFGCALLPRVGAGEEAALVLIAPTLGKHDYEAYLSLRRPVLVIASEDDFAAGAERLQDWFGRLPGPKQLVLQRRDNHFFRGHEDWLAETVCDFLHAQGR
jgi:alpha/beta superfamily hydrolase